MNTHPMRIAILAVIAYVIVVGSLVLWGAGTTTAHPVKVPSRIPDSEFHPVPDPTTIAAIVDTGHAPPLPTHPAALPLPPVHVLVVSVAPVATSAPPRASSGHSITGRASWYCGPTAPICAHGFAMGGNYAAAGPGLRAAICGVQSCTSWRGRTVRVNGWPVRLIDWCQCYWHESNEKLIDLYKVVFDRAGGDVTITW